MQVTKLGDAKNIKNIASSGIGVMLSGLGGCLLNMIAIQIETTVRTTAMLVIIEYMKIRRSSPDEISAVVRTSASMGGSSNGLFSAFKIDAQFELRLFVATVGLLQPLRTFGSPLLGICWAAQ